MKPLLPRSCSSPHWLGIGRQVVAAIAIVSLVACSGSADLDSYRTPWKLTGRETLDVRSVAFGQFQTPGQPLAGRGNAAIVGAGSGAVSVLTAEWGSCDGIGCGAAVVLIGIVAVTAAIIGGAHGASQGHTKAETEAASNTLQAVAVKSEPWRDVGNYVVGPGRITPEGPSLRVSRSSASNLVLQTQIAFVPTGASYDPRIVTVIRTTGTLQVSPGSAPVTVVWLHKSPPYDYFRLAEDNGALMKLVIRSEAQEISKLIRAELAMATEKGRVAN